MARKKEEREPRPVFWGENARGLTQDEEQLWHESSAVEHRSAIIRMRDERRAKELKRREREAWPGKIQLPNLGDARGIHGAIAKGAQAVVDGKLDYKQASILGYYLQLALSNVKRVDIEEEDEEELPQATR